MAKKNESRNTDTITRPLTAAVMMFGLLAFAGNAELVAFLYGVEGL